MANEHGKDDVQVTIDGQSKTIHRGNYSIADLKTALGVDQAKALDEVKGGQFVPLDDQKHTVIQGGEIFVSHARQGASSRDRR